MTWIEQHATQLVDMIDAHVSSKIGQMELRRAMREEATSQGMPNITTPRDWYYVLLNQFQEEVRRAQLQAQSPNNNQQVTDPFAIAGYGSDGAPSETLPSYRSRRSSVQDTVTGDADVNADADAGFDPSPFADGPWYDKLPAADKIMNINYRNDARAPLLQEPVFKTKGFNEEDLDLPEDVPGYLSATQVLAVSQILPSCDLIHRLPGKVSGVDSHSP
jgi:hypothetical protein